MTKTIKEWFESVEDEDLRKKLLSNMDEEDQDNEEPSLLEAIRGSFIWNDTPEGHEYWISQCNRLKSIDDLKPLEIPTDVEVLRDAVIMLRDQLLESEVMNQDSLSIIAANKILEDTK